jgi:anthranilate synthase/aminodeoxychorismate synthase-like glutamine amidotransferase
VIVILDNYDSFTYNIAQYIGEIGVEHVVVRNDQITVDELSMLKPEGIIISPGPCTPAEAGISVEVVTRLSQQVPILGVCLGHQAVGQAFGASIVKAPSIVHGKTSSVYHGGMGIFSGIPSPFLAARYHSLVVEKSSVPEFLETTAWTEDGIIMGLRHKDLPTFGVQFHPESFATQHGKTVLRNFLEIRC